MLTVQMNKIILAFIYNLTQYFLLDILDEAEKKAEN